MLKGQIRDEDNLMEASETDTKDNILNMILRIALIACKVTNVTKALKR